MLRITEKLTYPVDQKKTHTKISRCWILAVWLNRWEANEERKKIKHDKRRNQNYVAKQTKNQLNMNERSKRMQSAKWLQIELFPYKCQPKTE